MPARRTGTAPLLLAASLALLAPPSACAETEPLFSRHVVAVFSRAGCNAGACHGAVKGQNGFRLSLFGVDPALDHDRLLHEFGARRLNPQRPEDSLLLLKATGAIPHAGGKRMTAGDAEYRILHAWIAGGSTLDDLTRSQVRRLTVTPAARTVKAGESYPLRVEAEFADGSTEDVTALCTYQTTDRLVLTVDAAGEVRAAGTGDAAVVVRYRSRPALTTAVVPGPALEAAIDFPSTNPVDRHIGDKLRLLNLRPAPTCDDETFLRRVSLDVTGALPTPDEIRAFLADTRADKRARKIDELLQRPGHAALWATRFCDILRPSGFEPRAGFVENAEARRFYEWLRARLLENTPYDRLAESILLATSREGRTEEEWEKEVRALVEENASRTPDLKAYAGRKTLDLFWQRSGTNGVKHAVRIGHAFLGLRLECAQCHRHPHDVWKQDDLLSFANFFQTVSGVAAGSSTIKATDPLAPEIKRLKDEAKALTDRAKDAKLSKEEKTKLQEEAKGLTAKAKELEDTARRLRGAEIHAAGKGGPARVVSPLGSQSSDVFQLLGEAESLGAAPEGDPRAAVVAWMKRPDNPFFARAIVNRVWAHYFGRGIIDPPDHLSPLNPPSHPELLTELAEDFIKHGYDLRRLHRTILESRTYQLSAARNASSKNDTRNYASFYLRRLPAELLVDAINHATGGQETYPADLRLPAGAKALEVAGATGSEKESASLQYPFKIFGRPERRPDVLCDCERDATPTIVQTLYLTNHPRLRDKIASDTGRVARIVKDVADDEKRIEEVFLWTVSRLPTAEERRTCLKYVAESPTPRRGLEDVMWSLLNTHEFLMQH